MFHLLSNSNSDAIFVFPGVDMYNRILVGLTFGGIRNRRDSVLGRFREGEIQFWGDSDKARFSFGEIQIRRDSFQTGLFQRDS